MTTYKVYHDNENHMSIDAKTPFQAASIYVDQNKEKLEKERLMIIEVKPPRGMKRLFSYLFEGGTALISRC